jgi:hypothetical protein
VHEPDAPRRQRQRSNGAERRPRARLDHMIGVGLGYRWAHHFSLPLLRPLSSSASRPRRWPASRRPCEPSPAAGCRPRR